MWDRPLVSVSDNLEKPGKTLVFPAALFPWWIWDAVTDSYEKTLQEMVEFYQAFQDYPKQRVTRTLNETSLAEWINIRYVKYSILLIM